MEEIPGTHIDPYWGGRYNKIPLDKPVCGFFDELCPEDNTSKTHMGLYITLKTLKVVQSWSKLVEHSQ